MIFKVFLIFISMSFLNRVGDTQDKDFCWEFAVNKFSVNYGLEATDDPNDPSIFVFIGQNYWKITTKDNKLDFFDTKSQIITNWFGEQYLTAFEIYIALERGAREQAVSGLLQKRHDRNHRIWWAPIKYVGDSHQTIVITTDENTRTMSTDIVFDSGFNPRISHGQNTRVRFIGQEPTNTTPVQYLRSIRYYKISENTNRVDDNTDALKSQFQGRPGIESGEDNSIVDNIPKAQEMFMMTYSNIYVYKEGKAITYCFADLVSFFRNTPECTETKVLIDCSHIIITTTHQTESPDISSISSSDSQTNTENDFQPTTADDLEPTSADDLEPTSPDDLEPTSADDLEPITGNDIDLISDKDIKSSPEMDFRTTPASEKSNIWVVYVILAIVCTILLVVILISWYRTHKRETERSKLKQKSSLIAGEPSVRSIN